MIHINNCAMSCRRSTGYPIAKNRYDSVYMEEEKDIQINCRFGLIHIVSLFVTPWKTKTKETGYQMSPLFMLTPMVITGDLIEL